MESLLIIARDITERKRLERAAASSHQEVQALAANLLTVQEEERRRVSRELHDQICQDLACLAVDIGEAAANPPLRRHAGWQAAHLHGGHQHLDRRLGRL